MNKLPVLTMLAGWLVAAGPAIPAELPDPMRPPRLSSGTVPAPASEPTGWELRMVRISPGQRLALINGRIVKPGDVVSGARVLSVGPNAVQLRKGGKRFSVTLSRTSVKRPSAYGGVMMSEARQGHDP